MVLRLEGFFAHYCVICKKKIENAFQESPDYTRCKECYNKETTQVPVKEDHGIKT